MESVLKILDSTRKGNAMSLRRQGVVKKSTGTTALTLTVPDHKSIMVRDILLHFAAAGAEAHYLTVDEKTVQGFVAPPTWYLLASRFAAGIWPMMIPLRDAGLNFDIPVAAGQKLGFTAPGTNNFLEIVYDEYDAGDIVDTMPNGSKGMRQTLLQVISNSGVRATAGDLALDQSDLPAGFVGFPGGERCPANHRIILRAMFGIPVTKGTGAANGEYTTFLKALKNNEDIFDTDGTGINFLGDVAHTAATTVYNTIVSRLIGNDVDNMPRIIVFDPGIEFLPGDEFNVSATIARTGAGADFVAGEIKVGLALDIIKG